jgi:hypothetical protein
MNKIVAFHTNELNLRGTNVAVYDYAHYNETILGNKSYIISNKNADLTALKKFTNRFETYLYNSFDECSRFANDKNIQYVYYVKAGNNDGKFIPNTKTLIHAVFQHKDIHGDAYAYISEWLAKKMELPNSYVPYITHLPEPKKNFRRELNIPADATVLGRHGGYDEFNIPFVCQSIIETVSKKKDIFFVFMNTRPFINHPNIRYINGTYNLQNKSDFINTCDYMIHARNMGESFGLAISEFLFHDKPVIAWKGGTDQNHVEMLNTKGIWYNDKADIDNILQKINKPVHATNTYKQLVKQFSPEATMKQFFCIINVKYFLVTYDKLLDVAVQQLTKTEQQALCCYQIQKKVPKNITHLVTDRICEWELPWNDYNFQRKQYYEYGTIIHLYKNQHLLKNITHVGLLHYDIICNKDSINDISVQLTKEPNTIFYQMNRPRNQMSLLDYEYQKLCEFMSCRLNIKVDPTYIIQNGWISEAMSVTPVNIFLRFGEFLYNSFTDIEDILTNNIWGIMNHCPHRICGIVERMWGFYLVSLQLPLIKMNIDHDWNSYNHTHMFMNGTGASTLNL